MRRADPRTGTATLMAEIVAQVLRMIRLEADLAGRELRQNARQAGCALVLVAAGTLLALVALIALAGASVAGLMALGMTVAWAALLVGTVAALSAAILLAAGLHWLSPRRLLPQRTIANVQQDIAVLRERIDAGA